MVAKTARIDHIRSEVNVNIGDQIQNVFIMFNINFKWFGF
jgi:hypothetical protein